MLDERTPVMITEAIEALNGAASFSLSRRSRILLWLQSLWPIQGMLSFNWYHVERARSNPERDYMIKRTHQRCIGWIYGDGRILVTKYRRWNTEIL